jgi:hypothetical protein
MTKVNESFIPFNFHQILLERLKRRMSQKGHVARIEMHTKSKSESLKKIYHLEDKG